MPRYTSLLFIATVACVATVTRGEETAVVSAESDNEARVLGFAAPAAPAGNSTASASGVLPYSVTSTAAAVAIAATSVMGAMIF